jgi:hypothetical protein
MPVRPADVETRRSSLMGKAECAKRASHRSSTKVGGGSDI